MYFIAVYISVERSIFQYVAIRAHEKKKKWQKERSDTNKNTAAATAAAAMKSAIDIFAT